MKIHIDDLRKVKGIGSATIERIKEEIIKGNHEEFGCSYDDNIVPDHSTTKHSLYLGNCLDKLNGIPDNSIDLILTDPPYGTTNCFWDSIF